MMKKVIVIVGPTSSGKTKLSLEIAKHFRGQIINGDSVQVYKGYNIGSAKIKNHEKCDIPHFLIDIVDPNKQYDVFQFQKDGRKIIEEVENPIIVGGTGLYIQSLLYDYKFYGEKSSHKKLSLSNKELYNEIKLFDNKIIIDENNRRRLIRAYEIIRKGLKPSSLEGDKKTIYDYYGVYLDLDKNELKKRVTERINNQLNEGFIQEVSELKKKYEIKNIIGYREINMYLENKMTYHQMKENIISKTMKLAKRQKTWFKNKMKLYFFDANSKTLARDVIEGIEKWRN